MTPGRYVFPIAPTKPAGMMVVVVRVVNAPTVIRAVPKANVH